MSKNQNIIWIGPTGVGKTGLATAFLMHTIDHEYKGRYIPFPELIEMLYKSVADHSEEKIMKTFVSYDCLLIDEVGYVEVEPVQVGLFFTLMQKRHKKKTTLITSNLGFSQWTSFLKNGNYSGHLNPFLFFSGLTSQSMALYLSWMKSYTAKGEFFTNQKFTACKALLMSILIGVGTE